MGAIDFMTKTLKENRALLKKSSFFKDKSKTKYRNTKLSFTKGTQEEIDAFYAKLRRQRKLRRIKNIIIFLISLSIVIWLFTLILK